MRISVTDRCNLRCRYCMPEPIDALGHGEILRYEEILRICRAASELGIRKFKVTGGEPLVRADCVSFISALKRQSGTEQVTLTTNGLLLGKNLDALAAAGLDGINISLDSLNAERYTRISGHPEGAELLKRIMQAVEDACAMGLRTKLNAVLLEEIDVGDIIEIDDRAEPAGVFVFLGGSLVGGEHDLVPGEAQGLGHAKLRHGGAVHA